MAAIFQIVLSEASPVAGLKPDLVLVLAVMAGMLLGTRQGVVLAFLGGATLDLFSGMPFGFVTLSLLLVASIARFPGPHALELNPLVCMVVVTFASLLYYAIYSMGILALGGELDWLTLFKNMIVPAVVINTVICPFVYALYAILGRKPVSVREDWR